MNKLNITIMLVLSLVTATGLAITDLALADPTVNLSIEAQKSGETAQPSDAVQAVLRASQASDLAAMGRQMNSPSMMVAAAELLASVRSDASASEALSGSRETMPFPQAQEQPPQSDVADKPAPSDAQQPSWRSLLDEAMAIAGGNSAMLEVIASTRTQLERIERRGGTMGAVGGPRGTVDIVQARSADNYVVAFRGGELAIVSIRGDGDTDLDLYIYDENGNLIVSGTGPTDRETVSWTPAWTGNFRIRVVNLGRVWNRYALVTN